jgi:RNA-directed DNA polymerase
MRQVPHRAQGLRLGIIGNGKTNLQRCFVALSALTAKSRFARSLGTVTERCRTNRHRPVSEQRAWLSAALMGHYAYYGITGNYRLLQDYRYQVAKIWHKWLARRTRGKPFTWDRFYAFLDRHPLPAARIVHQHTTWNESLA